VPRPSLQASVFAVLAAATVGAALLTQRLEAAPPPIERVYYPAWISPNGDGRKDVVTLGFRLPAAERVTVQVVDARGAPVRTLSRAAPLASGRHSYRWDGRTDGGRRAPEGAYRLRVELSSQRRTLTALHELTLDVTPPRAEILAVTPAWIAPGGPPRRSRARIRYRGPSDPTPLFTVYRLDRARPREVGRFLGPRFRAIALWDGRLGGRPAPPGTYAFRLTVRDPAGNAGSAFVPAEPVAVRPAPPPAG
jgi:hypothetical protein